MEGPSRRQLFLCFLELGLCSFGGVLPWARRMLVERRGWMTETEFAELLGLGQILPGPNIANLAVMYGTRTHGAMGALLAFMGLMFAPFVIILGLLAAYTQYGNLPQVQGALHGMAAASAGLVLAMGIQMLRRQGHRPWQHAVSAVTASLAGLIAWPMLWVLACVIPLGVLVARFKPGDKE